MHATRRAFSQDIKDFTPLPVHPQEISPSKEKPYLSRIWVPKRPAFVAGCILACLALLTWWISGSASCISATQDCREGWVWGAIAPLRRQLPGTQACPLHYARLSYKHLRKHKVKPYILGGPQQPSCKHCHSDKTWGHFCHYRSHGPVCPPESQSELQQVLVDRAESGWQKARDMLALTPCDLFPLIRGRTVWLVGDSIMQEFMKAVQCFFVEFLPDDLENVPLEFLTPDRAILERLEGGWCAALLEDTRLCHLRCNMGDRLVETMLPNLGALGAQPADILVLNIAVWINHSPEYEQNLGMFAGYWQKHGSTLPQTIWRDASAQHFDTPTGDFKCDGCPDASYPFRCQEIAGLRMDAEGGLHADGTEQQVVAQGGWRNKIADPLIAGLSIPQMRTWNYSAGLWQFHHHYQANNDCTHSCHPSAYQLWIYELYAVLREMHARPGGLPEAVQRPINVSTTLT